MKWTVQTIKFLIVEPSPLPNPITPDIRLRMLFSNTFSLRSSLNVRGKIDNITLLYILIFKFF